jgi:hypothetical protein
MTYLTLVLLNVNLVAQDNKRKVLGIVRTGLDKKFVAPAVQGFERLCAVHIIHQYAAVSATVKGNPK